MGDGERKARRLFLEQWRTNFTATGALTASSSSLARAVTAHIAPGDAPMRILEAGPGTGAFTAEIARRMGPSDSLEIYEINTVFASYLRERIERDPAFEGRRSRITLHQADILEMPRDAVFDRIISGLPLNNFEPESVRTIFDSFLHRLAPGGVLSYFEYAFVRTLKGWVSHREERRRLKEVHRVTSEYLSRFEMRSYPVLLNLPPAITHHLLKPAVLKAPAPAPGAGLRPATAVR